ncbi:MAG: hypothetical protein M1151_01650 [Candidatus Thermoplasmatota archaeon]|nr:hypothetical protein [Candidatus Thermoplasmatota archaeon]MCL5785359.1 hypothetical protein [Candidatus Thermoplasmatota archaeon]
MNKLELKNLRFKRKLSRGKHSIIVAVPKLFLELMNAETCESVYVSISDENHLSLEVVR